MLTGINIVQTNETQELANQRTLNGHEQCGPGDHGRDNTNGITLVSLVSAIPSPLQTPVNGTEETQDGSTVSDLQRLENVEEVGSVLFRKHEAVAGSGVVEFP